MKNTTVSIRFGGAMCLALALSSCAGMPASGPTTKNVIRAGSGTSVEDADVKVIEVTGAVARAVIASRQPKLFSDEFGEGLPVGSAIGIGDIVDVAIWEAPPAALFGAAGGDARLTSSGSTARGTALPEQMVDGEGFITIPFVGRVRAAGRTPQEIAHDVDARLIGRAHQPQTIVRLVRNVATTVTVVGDVGQSGRAPLTARGERVLDILAGAGGVKQPVEKTTIQIARGSKIDSLPLEALIRDPQQNIRLQPNDIMTVLFRPYSFTALGATGRNEELPFEATGLSLAAALGRVDGLQDSRADVKGLFIFRLEDPDALDPSIRGTAKLTADGKVPVVYRVNMKDPAALFIVQSFPMRDKDVLYVSNAPLADFQKFLNVIYSVLLPAASTATTAVVATHY